MARIHPYFHASQFRLKTNQNEWSFNVSHTVRDCVAFHVPTAFRLKKKLHDNPTSYLFTQPCALGSHRLACAFVFRRRIIRRTISKSRETHLVVKTDKTNESIETNELQKKRSKRQTDIIIYNVFMHISFIPNSCIIICRKIRIVLCAVAVCVRSARCAYVFIAP